MRILFFCWAILLGNAPYVHCQAPGNGWKSLFDGHSLAGWRMYQNLPNNSWEIQEGAIHCRPENAAPLRADLITAHKYDDFELWLEWKIPPGSNSGIMYRVRESRSEPYFTGPEYQLIDDTGYPEPLTSLQITGADYDMYAPGAAVAKPAGEWNQTLIIAKGRHIEYWLNGVLLNSFEQFSADWKLRKSNSKWKAEDSYAKYKKGHICLQDHGDEIWFRSVMIREK